MKEKVAVLASIVLLTAARAQAGSFDSARVVSEADWSKLVTVTVTMGEFRFDPPEVRFTAGVPYKLTITNSGKAKHYFVSEGFFKGMALRKVETGDGEIKAPYLTAVEVFPGRSVDLYFVPVEKGTFGLTCTIKGHAEKGMEGKILVE
ncbi:MAG: hypothetical protein GTN70_00020 [Deltaproteobacteria bacterium]|nr:hypothetical protein [Deltaproteobacteria bacterium]NIS76045.1 hypothetical protein [Deltaproteobacteria bacterium]